MATPLERLRETLAELQVEIESELARQRKSFRYRLQKGRVIFEQEVRRQHRLSRERLWSFLSRARFKVIVTAPLIYSLIIPFVMLDLFVVVYQAICFPVYSIPKVPRRDHIVIDRHHLQYLNALQKVNCIYCGYCNGVASWVREVAARTEAYWCPIKHASRMAAPHDHYSGFADYGDDSDFQAHVERRRKALAQGGA